VPIIELSLCEQEFLVLKPNQLYLFTVMPGCKGCRELADLNPRSEDQPDMRFWSVHLTNGAVEGVRAVGAVVHDNGLLAFQNSRSNNPLDLVSVYAPGSWNSFEVDG
jgi:hypothetical protein